MENANFIAIDFETALSSKHPCQIGIVVVKNGTITERISHYIQPPNNKYFHGCIKIHGITPAKTKDQPLFPEVWKEIKHYFDVNVIVAHNLSFDLRVLYHILDLYNLDYPKFIGENCTYEITGYNLSDACKINSIPLDHHEALSDAEACAKLFLMYLSGDLIKYAPASTLRDYDSTHTSHTTVDPDTFDIWLSRDRLTGDILKPDLENADPDSPFYNRKVVITGDFPLGRDELAHTLKEMGADINTSVTRKTNIVLIGDFPGPKKLEKIQELNDSGCNILTYGIEETMNLIGKYS